MSEKVSTWASVLEEQAAVQPDAPFLYTSSTRTAPSPMARLDRNANRIAHYFLNMGAHPGDGVAILMNNSPEFLDMFFGIQKIGMYINTVNTALKGDGLAFTIDNSDTKYLVVDYDLLDLYKSVAERTPQVKTVIVNTLEAPEGYQGARGHARFEECLQ